MLEELSISLRYEQIIGDMSLYFSNKKVVRTSYSIYKPLFVLVLPVNQWSLRVIYIASTLCFTAHTQPAKF